MSIFYFNPLLAAYMLLLMFFIGACMGSFVNCIQIRLSTRSGSIFGRSECPSCGHRLGVLDLLPILSWIFLGGKCRYCKSRISPRYVIVEAVFGLIYSGLLARFGLSWLTLEYILLFTVLAAASLSDISTMTVPDWLHIAGAAVFLVFLAAHSEPLIRLRDGALGAVIYGGGVLAISLIADKIYKKDTLGGADIKIFAVLGLFFGPVKMLLLIILSCIIGLILALIAKAGLGKEFPFIPSITAAAYIVALCGDGVIGWYLGLFSFGH